MKKNYQNHDGNRLQYFLKTKGIKTDKLIADMGFSGYTTLHYYYNKAEIKKATLQKFLKVLELTPEQFYSNEPANIANSLAEDAAVYTANISKHQGLNLRSILDAKGINLTAFCGQLNISRPTLYSYFDMKELPLGFLLEAASVLEIKAARIKGYGESEKSFEKEIYQELDTIKNKLNDLYAKLK